jgi:hypothetical protein
VDYELVKFKREIACRNCMMLLVERGTTLAALQDDGRPTRAQSSGGYPMDELQERYWIKCDCGEVARFQTTADAIPIYGSLDGLLPIAVYRDR